MGAPAFSTKFVGQRTPKPVMHTPSVMQQYYEHGKKAYGVATAMYGAYQAARQAYPTLRFMLEGIPRL